jgi:hypothetical protein
VPRAVDEPGVLFQAGLLAEVHAHPRGFLVKRFGVDELVLEGDSAVVGGDSEVVVLDGVGGEFDPEGDAGNARVDGLHAEAVVALAERHPECLQLLRQLVAREPLFGAFFIGFVLVHFQPPPRRRSHPVRPSACGSACAT